MIYALRRASFECDSSDCFVQIITLHSLCGSSTPRNIALVDFPIIKQKMKMKDGEMEWVPCKELKRMRREYLIRSSVRSYDQSCC